MDLRLLAVVRLHEGDVREALLGDGADGSAPAPLLAGGHLDQAREVPGDEPEGRCDDERGERQVPSQVEQRAGEEQDLEHIRDRIRHASEHEALDRSDVAGQPR